ncbi:unnamed protein product, partial [Brassica oleracea var. botrytis]
KRVANERRRQSLRIRKPDSIAKKQEPVVHKRSKKTKKRKKSRPVREPMRAPSVESLLASDESEREGSEREVYRIFEFMGEGFVGLHFTVETKLESLGSRMSDIEKNQRLLRRRAEKIEDMLTSIESKVEPSHANSEKDKANAEQEAGKEKDNIENTEQEAERKNENSDEKEGARRMPLLLHLRRVADQRGNYSGWRLLSRRGRCVKQSLRLMYLGSYV